MSINNTFKFNQDFLKELYKRLTDANEDIFNSVGGEFLDSPLFIIPSLRHLEEIISVMFWASTQMEEGRLPLFRAIYAEPRGLATLGLEFDKPIEWSIEEIRKLAPAVTPPDGRICVYPLGSRGKKLSIQGMQMKESEKDPLGVLFEIIEPARMTIQFPLRKKVAEITGKMCGFIDDEWFDIGSELLSLNLVRQEDNSKESPLALRNFLYKTMTQEILTRMRLLRHGGSLIFVSESSQLETSLETPMKYECRTRFDAIKSIVKSMRNSTTKLSQGGPLEAFKAEQKSLNASYNKIRIADSARSVAYLTTVDGVTILNSKFEVISFGAKIKEFPNENDNRKVKIFAPLENDVPHSKSLTNAFRGKRHLSVARFVIDNPASIAFAVSQDGMITGFIMKGDLLTAYKGLELLL